MPDRRPRWTPADRETFKRAWQYLDARTVDIQRDAAQFTATNPVGWRVSYEAEEFKWGLLNGEIPGRQVSEDRFAAPRYDSFEEALKRHGILEADLLILGEFAALIGRRYDLNVQRSFKRFSVHFDLLLHPEIPYTVKPFFRSL